MEENFSHRYINNRRYFVRLVDLTPKIPVIQEMNSIHNNNDNNNKTN